MSHSNNISWLVWDGNRNDNVSSKKHVYGVQNEVVMTTNTRE